MPRPDGLVFTVEYEMPAHEKNGYVGPHRMDALWRMLVRDAVSQMPPGETYCRIMINGHIEGGTHKP